MSDEQRRMRLLSYGLSVICMFLGVAALVGLRGYVNQTTVALALLLAVLFTATLAGSRPAIINAVIAALCFNFFFLPPYGTLTIADPQNWVTLAAFLITAVTVGYLSASIRARAVEAEAGRGEIERLYEELRRSFERASETEALRRSEQLKSALLDAVTHDIRTPLTSIKASVTTLLDEHRGGDDDDPPMMLDRETRGEMLVVIDEEADRLDRFVEGLIELARIEAGEMRLRRRWSDVEEMVSDALTRAAPLIREHKIRIEIEPGLPIVQVDSRAVSEVIYTLVDNAAKYSPANTNISITAGQTGEGEVSIAVEDEGCGVSADLRERVFDKFFRATRDSRLAGGSRAAAGSGMGLAIAKGIVEAHDGRIHVGDARNGCGARFVFTLPIGDDEEEDAIHCAAALRPERR